MTLAAVRRSVQSSGKLDMFVFALTGFLIFLAIFGPLLAPDTIYRSDIGNALQPPSGAHWFGTDASKG